jgi:opacity protein-like surface antigen
MKNLLFTAAIILTAGTTAFAQKWYAKVGMGLAIPQAAQTLDVNGNLYSGNATYNPANDSIASFSIKKASFSSGFKGIVGVGYHFSSHFSVELYADLGIATTMYSAEQDNVIAPGGAYLADDKITQKSQFPIMLIPAMVFKTDKPKLNIYGRIGLVLPLKNAVKMDLTSNYISATLDREEITATLKTRFNIGFTGAGGVTYAIAKGISVFAEVNFTSLSLFAKETDIDSHTSTQSQPITTLLPGTKIQYGFSGQTNSNLFPTFSVPYSNMAVIAGINFDIK